MNREARKKNRRQKELSGEGKVVKAKFREERHQQINDSPLKPMNELQAEYIKLLREKSVVIATGYPGSSKTFIPTVMACDEYRAGNINKIYLVRPAVSNSKSHGYMAGDKVEKCKHWLGPVLSTMNERLGPETVDIAIRHEDIDFIPLEMIKGWSFKNCFVILDEAEDITKEEAVKFMTRIGENCTVVLAGDVGQSELKERSGLKALLEALEKNHHLYENTGWVDFNRPSDIVRSKVCKEWTMAIYNDEHFGGQ